MSCVGALRWLTLKTATTLAGSSGTSRPLLTLVGGLNRSARYAASGYLTIMCWNCGLSQIPGIAAADNAVAVIDLVVGQAEPESAHGFRRQIHAGRPRLRAFRSKIGIGAGQVDRLCVRGDAMHLERGGRVEIGRAHV